MTELMDRYCGMARVSCLEQCGWKCVWVVIVKVQPMQNPPVLALLCLVRRMCMLKEANQSDFLRYQPYCCCGWQYPHCSAQIGPSVFVMWVAMWVSYELNICISASITAYINDWRQARSYCSQMVRYFRSKGSTAPIGFLMKVHFCSKHKRCSLDYLYELWQFGGQRIVQFLFYYHSFLLLFCSVILI